MLAETTKTEAPKKSPPTAKDDYLRKIEAEAKEWDAQLALWGARLEKASIELRTDFHEWQREFEQKRTVAKKKLEAVRESGHQAWEELRAGAESGWSELKHGFESAKKKFE